MVEEMTKTWYGILIKYIFLILLVLCVGNWAMSLISFRHTDVTGMVSMDKEQIEAILQISLTNDPDMAKKINQYSGKTPSVDGAKGIGIVYIDGVRMGLHIDGGSYSMYGVNIGDSEMTVANNITYEYEGHFEVLDDVIQGNSTADFYYNKKKRDCLVVIYNDYSNRVVALTYFNNLNKVTKELSGF